MSFNSDGIFICRWFSIYQCALIMLGSIALFNYSFSNIVTITFIMNWQFVIKIAIITVAAWLPVHLGIKIYECMDPSEEKKI